MIYRETTSVNVMVYIKILDKVNGLISLNFGVKFPSISDQRNIQNNVKLNNNENIINFLFHLPVYFKHK
jgi:hypothetical protein